MTQYVKTCKKCKDMFAYDQNDTFWDESGSGYSLKLVKCPKCGMYNILKVEEDLGLDVNNDSRYY